MKNQILFFLFGCCFSIYAQKKVENSGTGENKIFEKYAVVNLASLPEDEWYIGIQRPKVERNQFSKYSQLKKAATDNQPLGKQEEAFSAASTVIQLNKNFSGITSPAYPPDNGTSISNDNYIVHAVNSRIHIYDTLGNLLTPSKTIQSFFGKSSGTFLSDPRVVYDAYADRFIVLISEEFNRLLVAFSQTNNPLGNWNLYTIQVDGVTTGPVEFFDYPYPMVNEHELVVSGYMFSNLYSGLKFVQVRKADGYAGNSLTTRIWNNIVDGDGNGAEVTCAVTFAQQQAAYGKKIYLIGTSIFGTNKVFLFEITDTINGAPVLNAFSIPATPYTSPPNSAQKSAAWVLETTDCRVINAILLNGILHFAYVAQDPSTNMARIVYNRMDVATKNLVTSFYGSATSNYAFPSIASFSSDTTDQTVVICYLESGANTFPSIKAVTCDNNMSWGPSITVKSGTSFIGGQVNGAARWGDYTSCVRKHNAGASPTVWVSGEYGIIGSNNSNWIGEITMGVGSSVPMTGEQNNISVYPNPVRDEFTLQLAMEEHTRVLAAIYDMNGKLVKELYSGWAYQGETRLTFNKNALSKGMYFLTVTSQENKLIRSEKIIIE